MTKVDYCINPDCHQLIQYTEEAVSIHCQWCGCAFLVREFKGEHEKIIEALAAGKQARAALDLTRQERDALQVLLNKSQQAWVENADIQKQVASQLAGIQTDTTAIRTNTGKLLDGQNELLREVRENRRVGQADSQKLQEEYRRGQQRDAEEQEKTRQMLDAQQKEIAALQKELRRIQQEEQTAGRQDQLKQEADQVSRLLEALKVQQQENAALQRELLRKQQEDQRANRESRSAQQAAEERAKLQQTLNAQQQQITALQEELRRKQSAVQTAPVNRQPAQQKPVQTTSQATAKPASSTSTAPRTTAKAVAAPATQKTQNNGEKKLFWSDVLDICIFVIALASGIGLWLSSRTENYLLQMGVLLVFTMSAGTIGLIFCYEGESTFWKYVVYTFMWTFIFASLVVLTGLVLERFFPMEGTPADEMGINGWIMLAVSLIGSILLTLGCRKYAKKH